MQACIRSRAGGLLAASALASTLLSVDVGAQARERLESFYATLSNHIVVHVEAIDAGVRVRLIYINFHDQFCWIPVVRGYEVVLPDTTVEALAGAPICALSERRVDRAVERSRETFRRLAFHPGHSSMPSSPHAARESGALGSTITTSPPSTQPRWNGWIPRYTRSSPCATASSHG